MILSYPSLCCKLITQTLIKSAGDAVSHLEWKQTMLKTMHKKDWMNLRCFLST